VIWWLATAVVAGWLLFRQTGVNAAGGGLMIGIPIGLVIAILHTPSDWTLIGKAMLICSTIGTGLEMLAMLTRLWQR